VAALTLGFLSMAPPRRYTPAEAKQRRRDCEARARARAIEAEPTLCAVTRCRDRAMLLKDYCAYHQRRNVAFGSPLAGPLRSKDQLRMVVRVRTMLPRLDPELVRIALATVEQIVVIPGQQPIPRQRSKLDSRYLLAVQLHRLQYPPTLYRTGARLVKPTAVRNTPLSAREAFVAATAAWLCGLIPGAVGNGWRFETERAIAMLVAHAVLKRRLYSHPEVYDHKAGKTRRLKLDTNQRAIPKLLLGQQLVAALAPMIPLMQRHALKMIAYGAKQARGRARNREHRQALATATTNTIPEFTF
jgi:hypothetical protein